MMNNVLKGHSSLGHYSSAGLTTSIKTCHCIHHSNLGSPSEVHLHFLVQKSTVALCDLSIKPTFLTLIFIKKVKVVQLCPTLCDPMDCSPPGSSVHGIFHTRALEWGAIAFSILAPYSSILSPANFL